MTAQWDLLIVSPRLEIKKELRRILDGLPVNIFVASTLEQANDVLGRHFIRLIFSEEYFTDGSYRNLLSVARALPTKPAFVLMLCTGDWQEYLVALKLGVTEVIRCPLQPTDVELCLVRVVHTEVAESLQSIVLNSSPSAYEKPEGAEYRAAASPGAD